jgi:uncharacterized membrane protein YgdD (TMEM256/DUF423 family)
MIETRKTGMLSDISPHYVATLAMVFSPLGAILGDLFIIHLVQDELTAVWLPIAGLIIIATYAVSLNS